VQFWLKALQKAHHRLRAVPGIKRLLPLICKNHPVPDFCPKSWTVCQDESCFRIVVFCCGERNHSDKLE
jgi:hypothetical protein